MFFVFVDHNIHIAKNTISFIFLAKFFTLIPKLIEWGQKNKFNVTFDLIEQELDKDLSPIFCTEVHIEGVSSGIGKGYTKKESQQNAAHTALRRIKNEKFFKSLLLIQQQHQQELSTTENVTDSPEPVDTETGQDNL